MLGKDGKIQNCYQYGAFGEPIITEESVPNRLRYNAQIEDDLTGLYYLRARYYNPTTGRFTQEDVIYNDGLNLYAYCNSNPVMYCDPSGLAKAPCDEKVGGEKPEGKNPNGYSVGDVDEHRYLSPGKNRAEGNHNVASEGRVQSHHVIQDKWAEKNVLGYERDKAPAILLQTGKGKPHTFITNSQRARRAEIGYGTSIQYEFNTAYRELLDAGINSKIAQKAIKDSYKYFDELGVFL